MTKELVRSYTKTKEDGTRVKVNVYRNVREPGESSYSDYDARKAQLEGIKVEQTFLPHPVELVRPVRKIVRGV